MRCYVFILAVTLSILASSCSGISTTVTCDPSKITTFTALVNEPIFLTSDKFPTSSGPGWQCNFQTQLSDTIDHPLSIFFTRSSFLTANFMGSMQNNGSICTLGFTLFDLDTSYDDVYAYSSYSPIPSSDNCKLPQLSLAISFDETQDLTSPSWSGFQAMAILAGSKTECPLSGGSYVLDSDPLRTFFIASSHMIQDETLELNSRACYWVFEAHDGQSIKVVIPWMSLDATETLTLISPETTFMFSQYRELKNTVFYFDSHVEILYGRSARLETPYFGFAAMVSAYKKTPVTFADVSIMTVTNMDEQHWMVNNSVAQMKSAATITIDPGYELQMSFDKFQLEQCCDLISLATTVGNNLPLKQWLQPGDFIALPASGVRRQVVLIYEPDASIEYAGFDLRFYGAKCDCLDMQQVVLTSNYTSSSLTLDINSPSSGDYRSYCSLMNCGYNVSIADDPSLANYSIVLYPRGVLRPIWSDYLLIDYGTDETFRLDGIFGTRIQVRSRWTRIRFASGASMTTNGGDRHCPGYSWTIRAGLVARSSGPSGAESQILTSRDLEAPLEGHLKNQRQAHFRHRAARRQPRRQRAATAVPSRPRRRGAVMTMGARRPFRSNVPQRYSSHV